MRCTCGFTRFRERRAVVEDSVQRWMYFTNSGVGGGFGATPFGTFFGAGSSGATWGLFDVTNKQTSLEVYCENCQRIRRTSTLGGISPLGVYISDGYLYVAAADVVFPVTCYSIRLDGELDSYTAPLVYTTGTPPAIVAETPSTTAPTPTGITVDTLLRARLPDIADSGTYSVVLVDRCCGCERTLATVDLEAMPMVIVPQVGDLNDIPSLWLRQSLNTPSAQPASGSRIGVPLEYCEAVLEYDARFATLPADQSWTHTTSGGGAESDFQLTAGGVLLAQTPGGGSTSYWEKAASLAGPPSEVHSYTSYLSISDTTTPAEGEGLSFEALYASNGGAYRGSRWAYRDGNLNLTQLNNSADSAFSPVGNASGWHRTAGSVDSSKNLTIHNDSLLTTYSYGTTGTAGADEIRARFGDRVGKGLEAYVKQFVVSTPGRFVRAMFVGYAPISAPKLRLYLVSDLQPTSSRAARVLVRYGVGTGDPYGIPGSSTGYTVNFVAPNTVYEVPFDLTGLTANYPFWFTVERDWTSTDDTCEATVWLIQATVRTQ